MHHRVVDLRPRPHPRLGADRHPATETRVWIDGRRRGDPRRLVPHPVDLPVQHVEMRLQVLLGRSEIQPVRLGEVSVDRSAARDHGREDLSLDRELAIRAPGAEGGRVEDVRSGVDVPGDRIDGLLQELDDAAPFVPRDQPERASVLDVVQRDRDDGVVLPVSREHPGEIEVRQDVSVHGEERIVPDRAERVDDRPAGSERRGLRDPGDGRVALPCLDERMERLLEVRRRQDHLVDAVTGEVVQDVVQDGTVDERQQLLLHRLGERTQPRAEPADEDDRLHRAAPCPLTYAASARRARSR
jgi:hypothetical protein